MRSTRPRYAARHRWRRKKAAGSQAALLIAGLVASLPLALVPADRSWAEAPAPQLDLALDLPTFAARAERPLHLGRALLETTGILVGGTIWYWRDLEFNTRDWDLQWDRPSWRRKLTGEALRFDQNLFQTNAVSHPRAGVAHYQVARGNGLGLAGSAAATLASSAFWEYVVEFKEHPAANDLIVNTVAGVAIGEPFYQLGEFFLRSRPTLWSRGLAAALSPVASANDWIDARRIPFESYDRYGFTTEVAHRFHLTAGYQQRTFDAAAVRAETSLGLGAELVMLPRYGRPGRFARWIEPGDWSSVDGRLDIGPYGVTGGSLLTRTTVLGYYAQSFARTAGRQIDGRGLLVGLGTAFEYEDSGRPGGADYLAVMNILGPVFELVARHEGLRLRWSGELYGDFAMVKALAFEGRLSPMADAIYRPASSGGRIPGVLGARGYYFAFGITGGTRLDLDYRGWDLGAAIRTDHFDAITGLDRFREEMTNEYENVDRRVLATAWLGIRLWPVGPRVSGAVEWRWRRGVAEELMGEHLDLRVGAAASFVF